MNKLTDEELVQFIDLCQEAGIDVLLSMVDFEAKTYETRMLSYNLEAGNDKTFLAMKYRSEGARQLAQSLLAVIQKGKAGKDPRTKSSDAVKHQKPGRA